MKNTFGGLMILALALAISPVDRGLAQALGHSAERARDHRQIRQNRQATVDDLADLEELEGLHQQYREAIDHHDARAIAKLDQRFMNILAEEMRESQKERRQEKAEIRHDTREDRRDLRDDVGDLKIARQEAMNVSTIRSTFGALVGLDEAMAVERKLKLMESALELFRQEVAGNGEESREDRRELREDRRESRKDRRQR